MSSGIVRLYVVLNTGSIPILYSKVADKTL
jgi:hypothetical protein